MATSEVCLSLWRRLFPERTASVAVRLEPPPPPNELAEAIDGIYSDAALFAELFDDLDVGVILSSYTGAIIHANDTLTQFLGYREREIVEMGWLQLTHPDDLELDADYAQRVLSGRLRGYKMVKRYRSKQHEEGWAWVVLTVRQRAIGGQLMAVCTVQDLQALQLIEQRTQILAVEELDDAA